MTANHEKGPFSQRAGPVDSAPIVIGDGSWIAAGVMILHGVTIGPGSIIGAGSVVTRDVPARTLALGTPARARAPVEPRRAPPVPAWTIQVQKRSPRPRANSRTPGR